MIIKTPLLICLLSAALAAQAQPAKECDLTKAEALQACTREASEGLVAVRAGGRWGFVSTDGRLLIPPRFDDVRPFAQGRAAALEGTRWGYVGRDGEWLIPPRFAEARGFSEDRALAREEGGPWQLIGPDGKTVALLEAGLSPLSESVPWQTDLMLQGWVLMRQPGVATLVTPQGLRSLPADVEVLHPPTDGLMLAAHGQTAGAERGRGYLGTDGRWAIPPQFDEALPFQQGFAAVKRGDQWAVIDTQGKVVRPLNAKSVSTRAGYWELDGADGGSFVWPDGRVPPVAAARGPSGTWPALTDAIRESHDIVLLPPVGGATPWALLTPKKGVRQPAGWVDASGKLVLKPEWLSFGELTDPPEWPLAVETLGGWGAVDAQGAWVIAPRFDSLGPFKSGRAVLTLGDNHGLAEASGRLLLPPAGTTWTSVDRSGLALFKRRGQVGAMRVEDGGVVWAGADDHWVGALSGGAFSVRTQGGEGLVDRQGRWLVPAQCEDIDLIAPQRWYCRFRGEGGRVDFLVDEQGRQTEASKVKRLQDGTYAVIHKGRYGILFEGGELVWTELVLETLAPMDVDVVHWTAVRIGPGPVGFHAIDRQGRRLASYRGEEVYRSREQAKRFVLANNAGTVQLVVPGGKSVSWAGDAAVGWNDPQLLSLLQFENMRRGTEELTRVFRAGDDTPRATLKGFWAGVSSRWMAYVRLRDFDSEEAQRGVKLWDLQTGRERQSAFQHVLPAGGGYLAVQGKEEVWGLVDERLQVVVPPAYTYKLLGRVSDHTVWAGKPDGLELLAVKGGARVGSLVSRCGQVQWRDAKGTVLWPQPAATCADSLP